MPDQPTLDAPSDRSPTAPGAKCALVVGVANKRSIAWAVSKRLAAAGTRLVLTYADERLGENVRELAESLDRPLVLPCDVTSERQIGDVYATIDRECGRLDYLVHAVAFAPRAELSGRFVETTRDGFRIALDVSVYSLISLSRGALPLMREAGGSILTLTYLGATRVFPNYNVMGVAKAGLEAAVRYLAADLGRDNVRVNALSAGPIRTLAAAGISGFSEILQVYRDRSALKRNIDAHEVAETAFYLLTGAPGVTGETVTVDAGYKIMGM